MPCVLMCVYVCACVYKQKEVFMCRYMHMCVCVCARVCKQKEVCD